MARSLPTIGGGRAILPAGFCYAVRAMPRRKKPRLKIPKEARRRARLGIGLPPPERVIIEKRDKPPKHKKTLPELIEEI
ncbi:MAG TPA: hypothetical protein VMD78_04995 [Candidatus Baltobacteraceae bacterium]|nr:hypothetical protein [Candidatus Baltobacteraceae bacterium]